MYKAIKKKNFEFPQWPSQLAAIQCRPIYPGGPLGWHWLAGKSEGHRGISKFSAFSNRCYYFASIENKFLKALFFYDSKLDSHIVKYFANNIVPNYVCIASCVYLALIGVIGSIANLGIFGLFISSPLVSFV